MIQLKDICDIYDCPHTTAKDEGKGYPLVRTPNVGKGRLILNGIHRVSEDVYNSRNARAIPEEGDLILAREAPVGNVSIIMDGQRVCLGQRVVLIKPKRGLVDPHFLTYYLLSAEVQHRLKNHANGAVVAHLNVSDIRNLWVTLPEFEEQVAIGKILRSIDDKIELNRQINDNLEQQIQTLYREWFIDNPKTEWATIALSEVATFVSGYSYKGNELVDSSETAMATIKNFERNGGFKLDGYKPVSPSSKLKEEQHAELFDILVAHTDLTQNAEVIGNAEIILSKESYRDVIFSMDLVKVVAKESFPYQFLLALLLKNPVFKSHCIGYVNGTTVLHMNKRALPDFNTQIPTCEDAARMNEIAKSIFTKMSENLSEIANLTKLRDSLLPKLMSGELKINEIDC